MIKKRHLILLFTLTLLFVHSNTIAQHRYPQLDELLTPFRMPLPKKGSVEYIGKKKKPIGFKATLPNGINYIALDDDGDMAPNAIEVDTDNDVLIFDLNRDGKFGAEYDLIIDFIDTNNDGKADYMGIFDYSFIGDQEGDAGHYMYLVDNDQDGIFGYINWNNFHFEGWDHSGRANFFTDYNGESTLLKIHRSSWNIKDLEYNWENPFLYYDPDGDGLTEMAIRMVDWYKKIDNPKNHIYYELNKKIGLVQMTFDLDNDTEPGNELDFDMSLKFSGPGFNYEDQIHSLGDHPIAPNSDKYFGDARMRHLKQLRYPGHDKAYQLTFERGEWDYCWFVFDEDDDCHRWERVEFYNPLDPFKIGAKNGGLDNHPQADATGDRGEWDTDFSGKGNLYISPLDGKIHLFGAEEGFWRVDQHSLVYQGWQGWRGPNLQPEDTDPYEPTKFATIRYRDTDENGFFDEIAYDFDGDTKFEEIHSLFELGGSDETEIIQTKDMKYNDYKNLYTKVALAQVQRSDKMVALAEANGMSTHWYNFYKERKSIREKDSHSFWLSFYILRDFKALIDHKGEAPYESAMKTYYQIK